ncbi:MAG: GreA/GreB family elongation factor [Methylobacter sp.]
MFFSAWVTLENEAGEEMTYRIVGADELDPKKRYISLDSPLARALLKKTFDDEVAIKNELKETRYIVVDIHYGNR